MIVSKWKQEVKNKDEQSDRRRKKEFGGGKEACRVKKKRGGLAYLLHTNSSSL